MDFIPKQKRPGDMVAYHSRTLRANGQMAAEDGSFIMYDDPEDNIPHVKRENLRKRRAKGSQSRLSNTLSVDNQATPSSTNRGAANKQSLPLRSTSRNIRDEAELFQDESMGNYADGTEDGDDHLRIRSDSPLFTPEGSRDRPPVSPITPDDSPSKRARLNSDNSSGSNGPVHLSRAHELKQSLNAQKGLPGSGLYQRKKLPEHDPENHEIKRLRVEQKMAWKDIARILNETRIKDGMPGNLTEASVYGRFVRNGPRVARFMGEDDFDPKEHMHIRPQKRYAQQEKAHKFTPAQDEQLVHAFMETQAGFWSHVAGIMESECGLTISAKDCSERYSLL